MFLSLMSGFGNWKGMWRWGKLGEKENWRKRLGELGSP